MSNDHSANVRPAVAGADDKGKKRLTEEEKQAADAEQDPEDEEPDLEVEEEGPGPIIPGRRERKVVDYSDVSELRE